MASLPVTLSIFSRYLAKYKQFGSKKSQVLLLLAMLSFFSAVNATQSDSDGDGLADAYETKIGTESYLSDTDGDTIKDGKEIGQNKENPLDSDNDGVINALDYDDDNDGLPTYLESKKDSDKDGLLDYLDTDSDNDGISDGEESGYLNQDKNRDGIDDAFDINREGAVDKNGDGIDDNVKLPDHNNDGKPDYLDSKFQHKKLILVKIPKKNFDKKVEKIKPSNQVKKSKKIESKKIVKTDSRKSETSKKLSQSITDPKPKKGTKPEKVIAETRKKPQLDKPENMIINRHTDSDNDGLSNALEKILGTNHLNRDSDGDKVSDAIEIGLDVNVPQDSDRDGIIDALDDDDDNDGVLTKFEDLNKDSTAINDDTDADGVPNYLDANDDGDSLLTIEEGFTLDSDGDGILNYLDKNDAIKDNSNKTVKTKGKNIPKEPEVVVLFDGDAAALTEEDEMPLDEIEDIGVQAMQDTILSSLDEMLDNDDLEDEYSNDASDADDQIKTSSSSNKSSSSHWTLF